MNPDNKLFIGCPVQHARQFLAGKWQMGILWNLRNQPLRFGEIKRLLPGISDKTLMEELDFFVQKKMIERNSFDYPSTRIEYVLSSIGKSLIPIINSIVEWGYLYVQDERVNKEMNMTPISVIETIENEMAEIV